MAMSAGAEAGDGPSARAVRQCGRGDRIVDIDGLNFW